MMRSLLGSTAVAGILVLSYVTAYLVRQTLLSLDHRPDGVVFLAIALLTGYVGSSLAQALRRSGGKAWIVQRIFAVALLVGVVAACTRGGVVVLFALAIGVAALPVELYLARATRRGKSPPEPELHSRA